MKKWMWLTVPATVVVLALGLWGGAVFAQEPVNPQGQVARSGSWTGMQDYCRGIMSGNTTATINWTEMHGYCQNASGMMGAGNITGGMMSGGGMMRGGMMGNGSFGRGMMGR